MIKLRTEAYETEYTPRYAVMDLSTNDVFFDSDDLMELFLIFQEVIYHAATADDTLITERIIRQHKRHGKSY